MVKKILTAAVAFLFVSCNSPTGTDAGKQWVTAYFYHGGQNGIAKYMQNGEIVSLLIGVGRDTARVIAGDTIRGQSYDVGSEITRHRSGAWAARDGVTCELY